MMRIIQVLWFLLLITCADARALDFMRDVNDQKRVAVESFQNSKATPLDVALEAAAIVAFNKINGERRGIPEAVIMKVCAGENNDSRLTNVSIQVAAQMVLYLSPKKEDALHSTWSEIIAVVTEQQMSALKLTLIYFDNAARSTQVIIDVGAYYKQGIGLSDQDVEDTECRKLYVEQQSKLNSASFER